MLSRLIVVVVVAAALARAAEIPEEGKERDSKLFPVLQVVSFDNNACEATSGDHGTCYSQKECEALGGTASGTCANGFGVCCVLVATCDGTVTANNTYFQSSSYPASYGTYGACMVSIQPPAGTCQILLYFEDFELAPPVDGDCSNDTFVVMGANAGSKIPTLCGSNTGQHMYIHVDNSDGPFRLISTMSALNYQRHWKIKITFLDDYDVCKAPAGCLQYYKETSGAFSSFNYAANSPTMLNGQMYAICFAYNPGFCDIGMNFNRFDLGNINNDCGDDYVGIPWEKLCGDFNGLSLQLNVTGPAVIGVNSDDDNSNLEEGFAATYMQMAC